MKKKIFSVFFTLVLVLSFSLVAAPVAAATTNVNLRAGGAGTAEWSTDEHLGEAYSAKLSVSPVWGPDYGLVNIFFEGIRLEDLAADPTFFANGVLDNGLGPYLNLLLENPSQSTYDPTGTYNDALEGEVATPVGGYGSGWKLMVGAGYYDADDSLGGGDTVNHDLAYWQTAAGDILVVGVQILFGSMGPQDEPGQTVYIDDVNFDGTLYDLEPATGAVTMSASSLLPATRIGITVSDPSVDFGELDPGTPSAAQPIIVTNTGNVAEDFTASILNESHPPVYLNGLQIHDSGAGQGVFVSAWEQLNVADGASVDQDLILTVPQGTAPGTYTATLVFWAEAAVL